MNSCNFIGNLTRDPELKYLSNNTAVCDFGLAINEKVKKNDQWVDAPVFLDIVAFGKTAENISKFFSKGKQIGLSCRARFEQWEDKQSGQKRSKVKFIVDRFYFTGIKSDNDGSSRGPSTQRQSAPPQESWGNEPGSHEPLDEDSIPF